MQGRATPTKIKELTGTKRPTSKPSREAKVKPGLPEAPEHLKGEALEEWWRITKELLSVGLLSKADRVALAAYCQCFARWADAERQLKESTLTIETTNGNIIQNPLIGIANKALELLRKYLVEFGMTPASRSKVVALEVESEKEDFC